MIIKAFTNHRENGVLLTFTNGNQLSTIWGGGTYCENYNKWREIGKLIEEGSNSAEVLVSCGDKLKKRLHRKFDAVDSSIIGYLDINQWLYIVNAIAKETKEDSPSSPKEI